MIVGGWLVASFPTRRGGSPPTSISDFADDELWALFVAVVPATIVMTILFWALTSDAANKAVLGVLMAGLGWMAGETVPLQLLAWRRLGPDSISRPGWRIVVPALCAVAVGAGSVLL